MRLLFLFLLIPEIYFTQNNIDSICFQVINDYRESKNKNPFIWSESAFNASLHHTNYMSLENKLTHAEEVLKEPQDRLKKYRKGFSYIGENVLYFQLTHIISDTEIANKVLKIWKDSGPHNQIMLGDSDYAAVSVMIVQSKSLYTVWATLVVYNP